MTRLSRLGHAAFLLTTLAMGAGLLPGCDQKSEASKAIDDAGRSIDAIAAGGGSAMEPSITVSHFRDAEKALDRRSLDGTGVEKAGVMVLKSRSNVGIAAGDALALGALERAAVERQAEIRSRLREWEEQHARADAAESYDPAPELADLSDAAAEIDRQVAAAQTQKRAVDARVAELESQIGRLHEEAASEREKAAKLELSASGMTAVKAAEVAPKIQEHTLAAEKKLFEVSRLQARVDHMKTEATEAALTLEKLEQQRTLNAEARQEIARLEAEGAQSADAARAGANEAAGRVRTLTEQLLAFRSGRDGAEGGGLDAVSEGQVSRLKSAVSSARQAVSELRVGAKAALGSANVALGDALMKRARSFEDLASLMNRLGTATPELPDGAWFSEHAERAREQASGSLSESREAYAAAAAEFSSVGGSGESAELLRQLSDRLRASAGEEPASESEPSDGDASADEDEG